MEPGDHDRKGHDPKPLIEYPTIYPFKVMGLHENNFGDYVRLMFGRVLGQEVAKDSITEATSKGNKYLSLTLMVFLQSEEMRQKLYAELHRAKTEELRIIYYL